MAIFGGISYTVVFGQNILVGTQKLLQNTVVSACFCHIEEGHKQCIIFSVISLKSSPKIIINFLQSRL